MRIENLIKYGFSRRVIDCWRESGLDFLLPLQVEALKGFGLLQGKDLLVNGPTSSGKTFCGELAAVRSVMNNQKAIFLVPLKALASEKYWELKKRYRKIGFKVIVVTSDYPGNKRLFIKGSYDMAVVVYEMFNSLTVNDLSLLESVGTVIFDEFQLVTTTDRGLAYELAISKVRNMSSSIQMIGLIGGLDECELFSEWLNISLLKSTNRPIELYRGVLFGGKFFYRRYNDCREGLEYFRGVDIAPQDCDISVELYRGVKHLVDKDEQGSGFS
jgi:helicase